MAAVAPDIALLRNEIIRKLRAMEGGTYDAIGQEMGITRQSVLKLVAQYDLDGNGSVRVLSKSDKAIVALAEKWGIRHAPIPNVELKARN
jgi:DNA-binding transcriptional regulator LsrR (DeoR family)